MGFESKNNEYNFCILFFCCSFLRQFVAPGPKLQIPGTKFQKTTQSSRKKKVPENDKTFQKTTTLPKITEAFRKLQGNFPRFPNISLHSGQRHIIPMEYP